MMQPGYTFVWGKDAGVARCLLDAADRLGVDRIEVRTLNNGFTVPDDVAEEARDCLDAGPVPDPADTEKF